MLHLSAALSALARLKIVQSPIINVITQIIFNIAYFSVCVYFVKVRTDKDTVMQINVQGILLFQIESSEY